MSTPQPNARPLQVGDPVVAYGRSGGQVTTGTGVIDLMDEHELDGEAYVSVWVRLDTPVMDDSVERKWITLHLAADRVTPYFDYTIELLEPTTQVYSCPHLGCDYVVGAAGPVDPDEPDEMAEEIDAHRRSHHLVSLREDEVEHEVEDRRGDLSKPADGDRVIVDTNGRVPAADGHAGLVQWVENAVPVAYRYLVRMDVALPEPAAHDDSRDAPRGTVGEVPVVEIWTTLQEVPGLMDLLAQVADLPRADVARALRAVADVISPEVARTIPKSGNSMLDALRAEGLEVRPVNEADQ